MAKWFEEYRCGCVSEDAPRKKDLLGYCSVHGEDRRALYKDDAPANKHTKGVHAQLTRGDE